MPVLDQRHSHRRDATRYPTLNPATRRSRTHSHIADAWTRRASAAERAVLGVDTSTAATGMLAEHRGTLNFTALITRTIYRTR